MKNVFPYVFTNNILSAELILVLLPLTSSSHLPLTTSKLHQSKQNNFLKFEKRGTHTRPGGARFSGIDRSSKRRSGKKLMVLFSVYLLILFTLFLFLVGASPPPCHIRSLFAQHQSKQNKFLDELLLWMDQWRRGQLGAAWVEGEVTKN